MKIQNSQVAMEGNSYLLEYQRETTQTRIWGEVKAPEDKLSLSALGLELSKNPSGDSSASPIPGSFVEPENSTISTHTTPLTDEKAMVEDWLTDKDLQKLQLLEQFLEKLTGKNFKFKYFALADLKRKMENPASPPQLDPTDPAVSHLLKKLKKEDSPQSVGWGIHLHSESFSYKKETVDFSSSGKVATADGRSIEFNINYHLSQEAWSSTTVDFKAGDALIDPLVIRLDEAALNYSAEKISFDLDVDSKDETFRVPVDHAGFLFYDRNGNQVADNGSELFGPTTGSGFAELKALDEDGNGWVDESDSAFKNLRVWIRSSEGSNRYLGLIEAGVGALFVGSVRTETGLYDPNRQSIGKMKETGIYLKENGQSALIHEFDLKV